MSETLTDNVAIHSNSVSVLGVQWDANNDSLCFLAKQLALIEDTPHTKRSRLSKCSSLFDLFGFLTPIVMLIKLFLSTVWEAEFDWDNPLTAKIVGELEIKLIELQNASDHFSISRPYNIKHRNPAEIHLFCDASFTALGCVVYLVQNGKAHSSCLNCRSSGRGRNQPRQFQN